MTTDTLSEQIGYIENDIIKAIRRLASEGVNPEGQEVDLEVQDMDAVALSVTVRGYRAELIGVKRVGGWSILGYTKPRVIATYKLSEAR